MKYLNYILVLTTVFVFSCAKNDVELDIFERECKNYKISNPGVQRISDACVSGLTAQWEVTFSFNANKDCIHLIRLEPQFFNATNTEITGVTYDAVLMKDDPKVTIGSSTITFTFDLTFANATDAANFNHAYLKWYTENEIENPSNTLEVRLNTSCSVVDPSTYTTNPNTQNIPSSSTFFTINLWDNAAEDGDIVSVYLNGTWIIENHSLLNAGTNFNISTSLLNPGNNDLVVFAMNEGSSGPNTVSISINGVEISGFDPGLSTGEAVRLNFF